MIMNAFETGGNPCSHSLIPIERSASFSLECCFFLDWECFSEKCFIPAVLFSCDTGAPVDAMR